MRWRKVGKFWRLSYLQVKPIRAIITIMTLVHHSDASTILSELRTLPRRKSFYSYSNLLIWESPISYQVVFLRPFPVWRCPVHLLASLCVSISSWLSLKLLYYLLKTCLKFRCFQENFQQFVFILAQSIVHRILGVKQFGFLKQKENIFLFLSILSM